MKTNIDAKMTCNCIVLIVYYAFGVDIYAFRVDTSFGLFEVSPSLSVVVDPVVEFQTAEKTCSPKKFPICSNSTLSK